MKKLILTFLFVSTVLIGIQAHDLQLDGATLSFNSASITPGDANCDGVVNILDVITISNYILGFSPEPFCFNNADLNNDGVINLSDLIATVNLIVGGGGFTCGVSTVTDIDGNEYNTVLIGDQCWMAENLKTTQYSNGTPIDYPGTNNSAWESNTRGAYAWYNNNISWKESYGALYNWHAVDNTSGLCPIGWHVPSYEEWTQLIDYTVNQGYSNNWNDPNGAGNALKSCRQVNSPLGGDCATTEHPRWNEHTTHHGFDVFAFSAVSGGDRYTNGSYNNIGIYGSWWNSTEYSSTGAWYRYIDCGSGGVYGYAVLKESGFSVRCLKD